jgi:hypothetical protein
MFFVDHARSAYRCAIALYNAGRIVYGVDADNVRRMRPDAIIIACGTRGADSVRSAVGDDPATRWCSTAR